MRDEDGKGLWRAIMRSATRNSARDSARDSIGEITATNVIEGNVIEAKVEEAKIIKSRAVISDRGFTIGRQRGSEGGSERGSEDNLCKDLGGGERVGGLDKRLAQRLRRGVIPIEETIDLHGMTRAGAAGVLRAGIPRSFASGVRCLLVITGKGSGLLRDDLPMLLSGWDLRGLVLCHCLARGKDGGGGARYVLLRKNKKKNRVI